MILVALAASLDMAHVDGTSVQYYLSRLQIYKGKRQVAVFDSGKWLWAYIPAPNAPELQARIKAT